RKLKLCVLKKIRNWRSEKQSEAASLGVGPAASSRFRNARSGFRERHGRELSVAAALGILLLLLAVFAPSFFDPHPLLSRVTAAAPRLVLVCGITLVLIARQIDISIGSLFAVCSVGAGLVAAAQLPWPVALLTALGLGALGGAMNGALVAGMGRPRSAVTLATMVTLREA